MRKQRSDGQETRRNLLVSACKVFASKGFRQATIAEICKKAKVNNAAVSYHFGSKEDLYVECWRYAFAQASKAYPLNGGISAEAPAEARMRGLIFSIMQRITNPKSHAFDIFYKEAANPSGLLTKVMWESVEPIVRGFDLLVSELLDKELNEQEVQLCSMSIRSQCLGPLLYARRRKSVQDSSQNGLEPLIEDVEQLADHITRFSLSGIQCFASKIHNNQKTRLAHKLHGSVKNNLTRKGQSPILGVNVHS